MKNPVKLTRGDARRLLANYHFTPTTLRGAFSRLGSVQFDPLNPVGRNHDLVLRARVPDYCVGDWERLAYQERLILDAWDKQASLVLMKDWPVRRVYHAWHEARWRDRVLGAYPGAVHTVLAELRERGPLTSSAFDFQIHKDEWQGSWYGPKLTKNVLRALWHTGRVVTHSRKNGHHVYDLAERVVPAEYYHAAGLGERESVEWLVKLRHQAVGLLRPNASWEVWSLGLKAAKRKAVVTDLVRRGELEPVEVEGVLFHALPETLQTLDAAEPTERMVFVAPLDQLVWDRKAVEHLFEFDYVWEVYKPVQERRWGYYVLPVFYRDRFVARFDSRLKGGVWELYAWYWEPGVVPDGELLSALSEAVARFRRYLGAEGVKLPRGLDRGTRAAWRAGAKR